jgi:hypothetical protein
VRSASDEILATADAALTAAQDAEGRARLDAMTDFMRSFEQLARVVASGAATWDEARTWATRNAERLVTASSALTDWEIEMGRIFHGGEEDAERALDRRSQHALAREVFRDTPADELLAQYEDAEVDKDFHDEAERLSLDAPSYVPRSHTWWRWR